jgi:L-lactate dehydrogenase
MITAGENEQSGGATDRADPRGRLRLLDVNADLYRTIILASCKPRQTPSCWS